MLPQSAHQLRTQNNQNTNSPASAPFVSQNTSFDTSSYFNLDPNVAAKQMAALNVVNMQRQLINTNVRHPAASPSQIPVGGTTPASFLGGMSSSYNQPNASQGSPHDTSNNMQFSPIAPLSGHSNIQPSSYPSHHNAGLQSNPTSFDPSMQSSNMAARQPPNMANLAVMKQKQRGFLTGLANVHISRGSPLPPALTGVPYPANYDPTTSPWKSVECTNEIGVFRLAGKDVDLLKLWGIVLQLGGGQKITQQNAWSQLLPQFDLPDFLPVPVPNGQRSTATILANYYSAILQPFEEIYRRNVQENNRKAMMTAGRPPGAPGVPNSTPNMHHQAPGAAMAGAASQLPGASGMMGLLNQSVSGTQNLSISINGSSPAPVSQPLPQSPRPQQVAPNTNISGTHGFSDSLAGHSLAQPLGGSTHGNTTPGNAVSEHHEHDVPGMKRRFESEEVDGKRAKLKTGGTELPDAVHATSASMDRSLPPNSTASIPPSSRPRSQFMRTKIEYIPLAREVDTYGGRDLSVLEEEYQRSQRRPMRDINEWGTVDIEALTMSIRSRLTAELSYALTTFTLLSTMKGPTPGSGFPISQCTDLLEEVLDLLEDEAFGGVADTPHYRLTEDTHIPRHRELVTIALDTETLPFAGLKSEQSLRKIDYGPRHRSGNIILAVTNIIRNLSVIPDNVQFMSRHERTMELVLRACGVVTTEDGGPPRPLSLALTIADLINVRKDALHILSNLTPMIAFPPSSPPSETTTRIATRIFELVASVLVEPDDAISPMQMLKLSGVPFQNCRPPSLPDIALDVFTRIAHLDQNRQVFSTIIPQEWIWRLLETLVYRLPVSDPDFAFLSREQWLSYLERTTMAIYTIVFLSPPELKKRIKSDRTLRFSQIMLRMTQRFATTNAVPDARQWFMVTARRAIEAMKVVDDGEDAFDTSQSTQSTLAFGMGFGETGETSVEKGTGLLGGRRDAAWELLMQRDLDLTMFAELESLMRVE
ncbi:hypothetical protein HYDPIDRAFT_24587 [Hydnomerulius pinastri MD-312]|nr:hypothetical protein HYDPIDRAFT_24587 [Hydnomerulius pinastri MD-312]